MTQDPDSNPIYFDPLGFAGRGFLLFSVLQALSTAYLLLEAHREAAFTTFVEGGTRAIILVALAGACGVAREVGGYCARRNRDLDRG
jgi:hypothetical protein